MKICRRKEESIKAVSIAIRSEKLIRFFPEPDDLLSVLYFEQPQDALQYIESHLVNAVFICREIPLRKRVEIARSVQQVLPDALIITVDSNGQDTWLLRSLQEQPLKKIMEQMQTAVNHEKKPIYIQTFGRFMVLKEGRPCNLRGKAKEILALVVTRRGREISNEEIYITLWENRPYSNRNMVVYYNALRRLKKALKDQGLEKLLISTSRGQIANIREFDCDYYDWLNGTSGTGNEFEGEFLSEYSWGEYILSDMMNRRH